MWEKRYFIPKTVSHERTAFTIEFVKGKNILHIGVGGAIHDLELKQVFLDSDVSNWFHSKITASAKSIITIELEQDNIDKFKEVVPGEYIKGDVTDPGLKDKFSQQFDVIVFTEILEHIDCYRIAFQNIKSFLKPDGQVIISTPNAYNVFSLLKLMFRYESNHIEHTAYFSYLTIKKLLEMNGFNIRDFYFSHDREARFITKIIKLSLMKIFPQFSPGILVVAELEKVNNDGKTE